jgi:hypothetical protein
MTVPVPFVGGRLEEFFFPMLDQKRGRVKEFLLHSLCLGRGRGRTHIPYSISRFGGVGRLLAASLQFGVVGGVCVFVASPIPGERWVEQWTQANPL